MHVVAAFLFVLSLVALPAAEAQIRAPAEDRATLEPYLFVAHDGRKIEADRGVLKVPEDRSNPASRTLELAFVRLPSVAREPAAPIIYLAGGPGNSGIESARGARLTLLLALREIGDVILLDQRGTGSSRPLPICRDVWNHPYDAPLDPRQALDAIREKARVCAEKLAHDGVAVSAYNAREIADDVDDLRRLLGAPRVNLLATSFGTHLALTTIRRHEASIQRAVLMGVVGPDQTLKLPQLIQRRLEMIGRADGNAPETSLAGAVETMLGRLEQPITVTTSDVLAKKTVELEVGPFDLQLATIQALSTNRSIAMLEVAYAKLLEGDFTPLARPLLAARKRWLGAVMPYAVICTSGISPQRWQLVTEQEKDALLGRWFDFPYPEICSALGVRDLGPESRSPVSSQIPVLLISGTLDVRTPVENAEEVLKGFPNGHHLVVEGAGHGDDLMVASPEIARNVSEFLRGHPVAVERIPATPLWQRRPPPPPRTLGNDFTETLHGVELSDPYHWLEDGRMPETRLWVDLQNRHTDNLLQVLPGRDQLRRELDALLRYDGAGMPWERDLEDGTRRTFFARRRADQERSAIVLRDGEDGEEQVLIDPETLGDARSVRILDVASDGRLLAYALQEGGEDEVEVGLFDVDKRRPLADRLPKSRYFGVSIVLGDKGLYYGRESSAGQGGRLYFHAVGTDPGADREVFGEGYDRGTIVWGNLSDDRRYLVVHALSGNNQRVDVFVQDLVAGGELKEVVAGVGATFYGGVLGDKLVLHTTWQAPRGRVLVADPDNPGREHWREIIPEREKAVIQKVFGAGGRLFVEYLEDVQSRVAIFDLEGRELGEVPFPAIGTLGGLRGLWHDDDLYLSFSSFHLPAMVYRFDIAAGTLEPWRLSGAPIAAAQFDTRQVWYPSKDGTRIPMFLIHSRDLELDGSRPVLLTAYGGFGTSLTPAFNPQIAAWVKRGGIYAVANVRGGGELGEDWHQAAVREHKQRSIDDLIAAAEWLIDKGYTVPRKLAVSGHSNGGLIVAAAMTQRPELFRAVVCSHPLLDMLHYNKFLAARFWLPEYGSPDLADAFEYLYAYSPYHRLDDGKSYPSVLFITAADDTRVAPLHVRKMAARMQALEHQQLPVMVRYHARGGHDGQGMPSSLIVEEFTDTLSFLLWQLGEL